MTISHMAFTYCTMNAALVHISNCHSDDDGITMIDSEFNSNANGAAITIESGCRLKIEQGLFLNHSGNSSVIQVLDGAQVTITDSQFNGSNVGSAIAAKDAFLKILRCNFTALNGLDGGAILLNVGDVL